MQLVLPLVSVVISNRNYGHFLKEAVDSVHKQLYDPIECVVVDDASTDTSASVIDDITASYPKTRVVRHQRNAGQAAACRSGFLASRGQYVVFMDADDVLHPSFVLTHVYVHLSTRAHPGLSSSDIFQSVDGHIVVCTGEAMNDYIIANPDTSGAQFRPLPREPTGPWIFDQPDPEVLRTATYVPPGHAQWCWSPGTANMFRRDAVSMFIESNEFVSMHIGADVFLCFAVGTLCGGVLIDRPLSLYRLHGGNVGTYQAQLKNVRAVRPESELSRLALVLLMEYLTRNANHFIPRLWSAESYITLLESFEGGLGEPQGSVTLSRCLAERGAVVSNAIGVERFSRWMADRKRKASKRRYLWRRLRYLWSRLKSS
jgi:glycosyltransferase involved in cell wall biosynthesis